MSKYKLIILYLSFATIFVIGLFFVLFNNYYTISRNDSYAISSNATTLKTTSQSSTITTMINKKPDLEINVNKTYTAIIHTTVGDIEIALDTKGTPITANNFIHLSKSDFYNNVIFHRVIPGFMIQGGDPTGTGMGGPGYKFDDEPFTGEYKRGTIAMANSGKNTNGSQFFIMHADYPLPKNYVIFGQVVNGLDTVDKIATAKTIRDGRENSTPEIPVKMTSVEILEK